MHDYETDDRAFGECLRDFAKAVNGGRTYGSIDKAADALRVAPTTLKGWMVGRKCQHEKSFRRLMTLIAGNI